jgi:transcriptional regulator with XRE-family HTH domain
VKLLDEKSLRHGHDDNVATRLLRLRRMQGLTQKEAAHLMGISRRTYVRWETGASVPRVGPPLQSAAAVLRRSPMFLLFGIEGEEDDDGSD